MRLSHNQVLETYADQSNWPTDLEAAKAFAHEAIAVWKWQQKAPYYKALVDQATSVKRVQEVIIYPLLSGEGIGVIR